MKQARAALLVRAGALLLAGGIVWGCGSSTQSDDVADDTTISRGSEWVESSHGKLDVPDTTGAFPIGSRRSMVISFSKETWDTILANMTTACGATGASATCTGSGLDAFDAVSAWHTADILTDGQKWATVGIKLRSNSELANAWKASQSSPRFPFRITMDKWEDEQPTIKNQRFYGFQKLSLTNLAGDSSSLRHQVASLVYRSKGVPAYRSTLVSLRIAHGTGINDTIDGGVYSLREMLDGPMLKRWFSGSNGNLYEPASFLTAAYTTSEFAGDGNDKTYTDVIAFMGALHAVNRTTDRAAWRTTLQNTFDVGGFINWLAISTVLGDKGGYGFEDGNYALYADQGKLHWMALDLDEALPTGNGVYRGAWHLDEITAGASLVKNVLADSVLCETYKTQLAAYATSELSSGSLTARVTALASQLLPGSTAADKLKAFAEVRKTTIDSSLSNHACIWGN